MKVIVKNRVIAILLRLTINKKMIMKKTIMKKMITKKTITRTTRIKKITKKITKNMTMSTMNMKITVKKMWSCSKVISALPRMTSLISPIATCTKNKTQLLNKRTKSRRSRPKYNKVKVNKTRTNKKLRRTKRKRTMSTMTSMMSTTMSTMTRSTMTMSTTMNIMTRMETVIAKMTMISYSSMRMTMMMSWMSLRMMRLMPRNITLSRTIYEELTRFIINHESIWLHKIFRNKYQTYLS
jgi:hypothetical protein